MSSKRAQRQVARRKRRTLRFGVVGAGGMGQGVLPDHEHDSICPARGGL